MFSKYDFVNKYIKCKDNSKKKAELLADSFREQQTSFENKLVTKEYLDNKILASEARLDKRIVTVETRLERKIFAVESKLERRISEVENRLTNLILAHFKWTYLFLVGILVAILKPMFFPV